MTHEPRKRETWRHDAGYKLFLSSPLVVEEILRDRFPAWARALDFSTLEKLSPEFVGDDLAQRRADILWKVRFGKEAWPYLLFQAEAQSSPHRRMAMRTAEYRLRAFQEMVREGHVGPNGELPPGLELVLYNGSARWRAPSDLASLIAPSLPVSVTAATTPAGRQAFGLHTEEHYHLIELRALDPADLPPDRWLTWLVRVEQARWTGRLPDAVALGEAIRMSGDEYIRQTFRNLYVALGQLVGMPEKALESAEFFGEEGMIRTEETLMAQSVRRMKQEWRRKALEEGWREGEQRGLQRGLQKGLQKGLRRQRALVLRQARLKFGAETAAQLKPILGGLSDAKRIATVADAIIESAAASDFIRSAREA